MILCVAASTHVRLLQQHLQLCVGVGLNGLLIYADGAHLEGLHVAFIHQEMQRGDQIAQVGIDAHIIVHRVQQVLHIALVNLRVEVFELHCRIDVLVDLPVALPVVP